MFCQMWVRNSLTLVQAARCALPAWLACGMGQDQVPGLARGQPGSWRDVSRSPAPEVKAPG